MTIKAGCGSVVDMQMGSNRERLDLTSFRVVRLAAFAFGLGALAGCGSKEPAVCSQEGSLRAPLRGNMIINRPVSDADGGGGTVPSPGVGSLVFVELCGLYTDNPDPSKGHPNYRYVALADEAGKFEVSVPSGPVGLHTLLDGYYYGFKAVADSTSSGIQVNASPLGLVQPPVATSFAVTPSEVGPGEPLSFSLMAQAAQPSDPLSDEVLLAEPLSGFARAFDPPSAGEPGKSFPNGRWTLTVPAPAPGVYTYYAQAVSEGCAVSARQSVTVTVR